MPQPGNGYCIVLTAYDYLILGLIIRCSFFWDKTDISGTQSKNLQILEVYFIASSNALHPFLHGRWEKNSAYSKNIGYWVWEDSIIKKNAVNVIRVDMKEPTFCKAYLE